MKLTVDFEKKQITFTGDGSVDDFTQCVEALESIGYEEGWTVSCKSAEIPQLSNLFDRMSKPYANPPENPFNNPADIYTSVQVPYTPPPTINPYAPPYVVTCESPSAVTATSAVTNILTNLNYDQFNQ